MAADEKDNVWYRESFYDNSVKPGLEAKGEVFLQWHTSKNELVKQLNYLRFKYKLICTWSEKYTGCYQIFIKKKEQTN